MVIRLQPARLLPNMYSLTNALTSVPEVLLMVLTVYGLNKAEKRLSIPASAVLVLWTIAAVVVDGGRSHYYHGVWFGGDSIYSAIFLWTGIYS